MFTTSQIPHEFSTFNEPLSFSTPKESWEGIPPDDSFGKISPHLRPPLFQAISIFSGQFIINY